MLIQVVSQVCPGLTTKFSFPGLFGRIDPDMPFLILTEHLV